MTLSRVCMGCILALSLASSPVLASDELPRLESAHVTNAGEYRQVLPNAPPVTIRTLASGTRVVGITNPYAYRDATAEDAFWRRYRQRMGGDLPVVNMRTIVSGKNDKYPPISGMLNHAQRNRWMLENFGRSRRVYEIDMRMQKLP